MRYGIISDIHGNLEALQAVISACRQEGVRRFYCVGDIVGYGANPNECIEYLQSLKATAVAGNHDWAAIDRLGIEQFNSAAAQAIEWTKKYLTEPSKKYLQQLKLVEEDDGFIIVHGSLNRPEEFLYIQDITHTADTFYLMKKPICFIGHTHVPQVYIKSGHNLQLGNQSTFHIHPEQKIIINVGAVGQPRDGNPMAVYCIYDPDLQRIELKRVAYPIALTQKKMIEAGLPDVLAKRLSIGQ